MKKKILFAVLAVLMVSTAGCVSKVNLDEEQEAKFIQYSVYSVLEHDKNYVINLEQVTESELPEINIGGMENQTQSGGNTENESTSGQNGENTEPADTEHVVGDINTAVGIDKNIRITYKGFKACDAYPEVTEEPAFVIKAIQGKKLVVVSFELKNNSEDDVLVDVLSKKISFKGVFNNSIKTNALQTLLPNALNSYKGTIPAGGTVTAVLVFQMSDGYVDNLTNVTVDIVSEDGTKSIKLQ